MATLTAYATTNSQDLGPGSNLTVTVGGKQVFLLDSDDQIALQSYLDTATRLPTSDSGMRALLGYTTDAEGKKFADLVQVYSQIFSHCWHFKTEVFPESVFLAFLVSNYARMSFIYYDRILKVFGEFLDGTRTESSTKEIVHYTVNELRGAIHSYAAEVSKVHTAFQTFDTETTADQGRIELAANFYSDEFNLNEDIIKQKQARIDALKSEIAALKIEYDQAVIVAATTPIYAWIPFVGWLVGPTVAGIYGAKAVELEKKMAVLGEELRTTDADLQLRISLKASLSLANSDLAGLKTKCAAALKALARIKTVWTNVDAALERLSIGVNDINNKETLRGLKRAVESAETEWDVVYQQAENYTATAYLRVEEMIG